MHHWKCICQVRLTFIIAQDMNIINKNNIIGTALVQLLKFKITS